MAELSPVEYYLIVHRPVTVFTGQISSAPSEPYNSLAWDGGATGSAASLGGTSGAPMPYNTLLVGTSAGAQDRGILRIRSWTPAGPTDPTTGTLVVGESDDVGPFIENNDHLTALLDFRLFPRIPRLVQTGNDVTFYEDYDIAYTNQTNQWRPTAAIGPPAVGYLEGGSATISFVGDRSTAHAAGASVTGWAWVAYGSSELTSSSEGTEGSPVTFTYTAAGQYLVQLQVSDTNGRTHTAYTWVFIIDPANLSDMVYSQFDAASDSGDRGAGGGEASYTVHGVASVAQFPRDTMVIHAKRGSMTTETGTWPFRADVLHVGHIMANSITQDPRHNTTSFRVANIHRLMNNLKMYPVSITDFASPSQWVEGKSLTVDRMASFLFKWRSTLDVMTSVVFSGYAGLIQRQDFGPTTLYQQVQSLMNDAWIKVTANHQNVLYLEIEYNYQLLAERSAATTRKALHKGLWASSVTVAERQEYDKPASKIKSSGILYGGNGDLEDVTPLFCEAPGDLQKAWGRESGKSRYILESQADLNTRTGYMLAKENYRFPSVRMTFINDGSFTIAPQEVFPAVIEATDNNRGLSFNPDLIPRRVRRSYDHKSGAMVTEVEFEVSTTGPPGVTISMPNKPPRPTHTDPPPPEWEPIVLGLAAWKPEGSYRYRGLGGSTWENRDAGLSGSDIRDFFGGVDPWWWTTSKAGTYDPDQVVTWRLAEQRVHRSANAGRLSWADVSPTGVETGTYLVGFDSNLFTDQNHLMIGRWSATGSNHFSGLWVTDDDGDTWSYTGIF